MTNIGIQNAALNEMPLLYQVASIERRSPRLNNAGLLFQFVPNTFFIPVNGTEITELIRQLIYFHIPDFWSRLKVNRSTF